MNKPFLVKHPLFSIMNTALVDLPAPINISMWWDFGSLLRSCLVIQIITGIFLAMLYTADISLPFSSVCVYGDDSDWQSDDWLTASEQVCVQASVCFAYKPCGCFALMISCQYFNLLI